MSGNLSTTSSITYLEDALVIKVKTGSPAALHWLILQGLVSALRLKILDTEHIGADVDGLVALSNVLTQMTPTEMHLQKAYSPAA